MKLVIELWEKDIFPNSEITSNIRYALRRAARAIVSNSKGQIGLLHISKNGYYKLPGGGVDAGETVLQALARELLEEMGCTITTIKPFGLSIEYRDQFSVLQISYCYFAKAKGALQKPALTNEEEEKGAEQVWVDFRTAVQLVKKSVPTTYDGKFIQKRDLAFLLAAQKVLPKP